MPRIGILSDIHGNLEALEAVLSSVKDDHVDYLVHLGDLVGYNANPSECLQLVRQHKAISVLGNHDLAILEPQVAENFNVLAHQALLYAQRQLSPRDVRYLQGLPRVEVVWDRYLLCHGSPENLETYILNVFQARRIFNLLAKRYEGINVCFFGHTHIQYLWLCDQRGKVQSLQIRPPSMTLEPEFAYLINPGSVGQPRQGDNKAHYLIFDSDREMVQFKAVPYDIRKAQDKILRARLPQYLALRLQDGI
jgi:predicted phosphodiesterase